MPDKKTPSLERRIAAHPKIAVDVSYSQGKIDRIALSACKEGFVCRLFGEVKDEAALLSFLKAYSSKKEAALPPLDFSFFPPFTRQVLKRLTSLGIAETVSYQEVAGMVGNPRAARAVGNACRVNPFPLLIPCHRVLASNGKLCGFAFGNAIKQILLDFEGS